MRAAAHEGRASRCPCLRRSALVHRIAEARVARLTAIPEAMRLAIAETQDRVPDEKEIREHQQYLREALEERRVRTTVPRTYAVTEMIAVAPELARIVAQRSWMLVETPVPALITSDVPVALGASLPRRPADARRRYDREGDHLPVGLAPLHPPGKPNEPSGRFGIEPASRTVELLNNRQCINARRFTFQHPATVYAFDDERAARPWTEATPDAREPAER